MSSDSLGRHRRSGGRATHRGFGGAGPVALHGAILALARLWAKDPDGEQHSLTGRSLEFRNSEDYVVPACVAKRFYTGGVWLPTEPSKPLPLILGIEVYPCLDLDRPAKPDPQLAPETTSALVTRSRRS